MKFKISINDMYLNYTENCKRIDIVAEIIGLKPISDWKRGIDYDMGPLTGSIGETREKIFEGEIEPEKLKIIMKGAEYIRLDRNEADKLKEQILEFEGRKYIKTADIDVWIETKILLTKTWDKIPSRRIEIKMKLKGEDYEKYCIKYYENIISKANKTLLNKLREVEKEIIRKRIRQTTES